MDKCQGRKFVNRGSLAWLLIVVLGGPGCQRGTPSGSPPENPGASDVSSANTADTVDSSQSNGANASTRESSSFPAIAPDGPADQDSGSGEPRTRRDSEFQVQPEETGPAESPGPVPPASDSGTNPTDEARGDPQPEGDAADASRIRQSDEEPSGAAITHPVSSDGERAPVVPDSPLRPTQKSAGKGPTGRPGTKAPAATGGSSTNASGESAGTSNKTGAGAKRDPLFVDWPQPKLALFITGQQQGYIEPCGCTGLTNQKGGLARRATLYRQLEQKGWPLVAVDVGNQVRRFGRQAELQFQTTADALKKIGYRAIAFGADDLRLSSGELIAVTAASDNGQTPFVSANAAVLDENLTPQVQIVEVGDLKIGITAIVGDEQRKKIVNDEIVQQAARPKLKAALATLKQAQCDWLVLLAHTSVEDGQALAREFPEFQIIVTAGGVGEPPYQPTPIEGSKTWLIEVGAKCMYVGVVGVFDDPKRPLRFQRVPLDARFEDDPQMLQGLADYQEQLRILGLEGLGLKPLPHPSGREFVGSKRCGECHREALKVWKGTSHAEALESLVHPGERSEIQRHFDPECLSCHVTGWNAQKHFPFISGYLGLEESKLLHGVGCENCHGPGSAHAAAESGDGDPSDELLSKLRGEMRLPLEAAEQKCMECHDLDNSPEFHKPGAFERYWKDVEHAGVD